MTVRNDGLETEDACRYHGSGICKMPIMITLSVIITLNAIFSFLCDY